MRSDLVLESFDIIRAELFEDVIYTPRDGQPVTIAHAIAGVETKSERFDMMGEKYRSATHVTHAAIAALPTIAKGDFIDDGQRWRVTDIEPVGDARCEILLALVKA